MTVDARHPPALLPAGLRDLLPPEAEAEADAVASMSGVFASHGYERVEPPLLEFEDTLLAGTDSDMASATFRMIDPETHRMMGLRPDMTPQVARIAATRLAGSPRPLRLAYAGPCVTLRRGQLTSDRQIPQVGIELIGVDLPDADAEIVAIGAEAVAAVGVAGVSFDLTLPTLAPALVETLRLDPQAHDSLLRALDRKDAASVRRFGGRLADTLEELLLAAGPAPRALAALSCQRGLPTASRLLCDRLEETVRAIETRVPGIRLTIDPVEFRGWRYHTGVCVSVLSAARHEELGRGGRYLGREGEPACGLTLFPAALLRATPPRAARPRLYVPLNASPEEARLARADGFATVAELAPAHPMLGATRPDPRAEARRLLCTHLLSGSTRLALDLEPAWQT